MRRGLMGWDASELPVATLTARIERLREAMRRDGLDAFLIYTNFVRPSAVAFLTGFTPYWSDGVLLVRGSGEPLFATALSKRVAGWIMTTTPVAEVVNAPHPGTAAGERLAADYVVKRVGVLELDALPAGLSDDIAAAAPGIALVDASATFADVRRHVDEAERRLLARADAIARASLNLVDIARAGDAGAVAGEMEKHARLAGAEEVQIAVAADLDADRRMVRATGAGRLADRFALRASVAYKGSWVRRVGTFARDVAGAEAGARADVWLASVAQSLAAGAPYAEQVAGQIARLGDATLVRWVAEACVGSYPLEVVASSQAPGRAAPSPGTWCVLTIETNIGGVPWIGAAPIFVGS
jgi:hypothetical protein